MLKDMFGDKQMSALADMIQAALSPDPKRCNIVSAVSNTIINLPP